MKRQLSTLLLGYFRVLAQIQLTKFSPLIIGITGSAGKTSTLQACEAVLADHFKLKVSHKANSETGIPLNILNLHPHDYSKSDWLRMVCMAPVQLLRNWNSFEIYLVEMGIDGPSEPKNMSYLLKIIKPKVGIFLNAGPTHAEPFDHLITEKDPLKRRAQLTKLIAFEKGKLITALPSSGFALLNADDSEVIPFQDKTKAQVLTFGKKSTADIRVTDFQYKNKKTELSISYQTSTTALVFNHYLLPELYTHTLAAAIGCGISQGLTLDECKESLEKNFKLPPGRASLIEGIHDSLIIDSTYNSSTVPLLDMLELLKNIDGKRKIALLGDMRELGNVTETEHQTVAKKAAAVCDQVFLVGPFMQKYAVPVIQSTTTPVRWFPTAHSAAEHIKTILQKDDVLLVKASQNTLLLESAVELLMAHQEAASTLLCRRGPYWDKQRKKLI